MKAATEEQIHVHLRECNDNFVPSLSERVNLQDFSRKIFKKSVTFEAWDNADLAGLVSCYFNDINNLTAYINNVSIVKSYMGKGIAKTLLSMCVQYAERNKFNVINLEVQESNNRAIQLYKKVGFESVGKKGEFSLMRYEVNCKDYSKI